MRVKEMRGERDRETDRDGKRELNWLLFKIWIRVLDLSLQIKLVFMRVNCIDKSDKNLTMDNWSLIILIWTKVNFKKALVI